jgi:Txe/YoeB family toxin of toxin-antitoxin system
VTKLTGSYKIYFTNQALKDAKVLAKKPELVEKVKKLLKIIENNPYTPVYEKLLGDFKGAYSRRINIQHRLVYQVLEKEKIVKVIRMYTHYE